MFLIVDLVLQVYAVDAFLSILVKLTSVSLNYTKQTIINILMDSSAN